MSGSGGDAAWPSGREIAQGGSGKNSDIILWCIFETPIEEKEDFFCKSWKGWWQVLVLWHLE